jgi:hypothetical protein
MAFSFFSLGIPTHPIPDKLYACSSLKQTYSLPGAFQGNEQFWLIAFYFFITFTKSKSVWLICQEKNTSSECNIIKYCFE